MELSQFSNAFIDVSESRRLTLLELVDAWAAHVLRLFSERLVPADANDAWGIHDFMAALLLRDQLQRGMTSYGVGDGVPAIVQVSDELYRQFTIFDDQRLLIRIHPDVPSGPWWWHRIPATGPVAAELGRLVR